MLIIEVSDVLVLIDKFVENVGVLWLEEFVIFCE